MTACGSVTTPYCYSKVQEKLFWTREGFVMMKLQKQMLRKEIKSAAASLECDYCKMADQCIRNHIIEFGEFHNANTVFCYVGTDHEIDTIPLLEHILKSGKRLGVPKCVGKGIMEVYEILSLDELQMGSYGIREPKAGSTLIRPEEIDIALVPCLSCNQKGWRIGYGGGFYDRYLVQTNARRAVLCRDKLIRENIPVDHYDLRMDFVITEKGIVSVK